MTEPLVRRMVGPLIAAAFAVAVALGLQFSGLLSSLEQRSIEKRFELRGAERPEDVAVVAIDDVTFDELGQQWPFPRSLHGRLIDRLRAAGVRKIVYDVQFTEPTRAREDYALFRAIARARGVVLATTEFDEQGRTNVLGGDENLARAHARAAASNLPEAGRGVLERFPHDVRGVDSIAVAVAEDLGIRLEPARFRGDGAWIDFRGPPRTVPTMSFSSVLRGETPPHALRGRVVVVGASAPTLQDLHATLTGSEPMSGPEIQANAIWTALHDLPLSDAPTPVGILLVVLIAIAAPLAWVRFRLLGALGAALGAGAAYLVTAQLLFDGGTIVWVVAPLAAVVAAGVAMVVVSYVAESVTRRRVAHVNEVLEERVRARTRELRETQLEILRRLARAAEWRDQETGEHIERIGILSQLLGTAIGLPPEESELLLHASTAHDIGKIGIPDRILLKPAPLTPQERVEVERHAAIGAAMLDGSDTPLLQLAETIALTHHERWDGSGYPNGLAGESIPLPGRICAIVDVFDALVSPRPYKSAWSLDDALAEIAAQRGRHFDPELVDPFLEIVRSRFDELYDASADVHGLAA